MNVREEGARVPRAAEKQRRLRTVKGPLDFAVWRSLVALIQLIQTGRG